MVLKKLLLTGSSGMLGSHFIREFVDKKIDFICSSRSKPNYFDNIKWFKWDLAEALSPRQLRKKTGKIDAIFHVGSYVPKSGEMVDKTKIFDSNVKSAIYLSEFALEEDVPICFISGATVYDKNLKGKICETDKISLNGIGGFYGFSKTITENIFQHFVEKGLKLVIIRPSSIYGFGQHKTKLVIKFLNSAIERKTINLVGPFSNKINFIHASDVVLASLIIIKNKGIGIYNIADNECYSIDYIAKLCLGVVGSGDLNIEFKKEIKNKEELIFNLNSNLIKEKYNFKPKMSIEDGILQTYNDIRFFN